MLGKSQPSHTPRSGLPGLPRGRPARRPAPCPPGPASLCRPFQPILALSSLWNTLCLVSHLRISQGPFLTAPILPIFILQGQLFRTSPTVPTPTWVHTCTYAKSGLKTPSVRPKDTGHVCCHHLSFPPVSKTHQDKGLLSHGHCHIWHRTGTKQVLRRPVDGHSVPCHSSSPAAPSSCPSQRGGNCGDPDTTSGEGKGQLAGADVKLR